MVRKTGFVITSTFFNWFNKQMNDHKIINNNDFFYFDLIFLVISHLLLYINQ